MLLVGMFIGTAFMVKDRDIPQKTQKLEPPYGSAVALLEFELVCL